MAFDHHIYKDEPVTTTTGENVKIEDNAANTRNRKRLLAVVYIAIVLVIAGAFWLTDRNTAEPNPVAPTAPR